MIIPSLGKLSGWLNSSILQATGDFLSLTVQLLSFHSSKTVLIAFNYNNWVCFFLVVCWNIILSPSHIPVGLILFFYKHPKCTTVIIANSPFIFFKRSYILLLDVISQVGQCECTIKAFLTTLDVHILVNISKISFSITEDSAKGCLQISRWILAGGK